MATQESAGLISHGEIDRLVAVRRDMRRQGDYQAADLLRELLAKHGCVVLNDNKDGTTWWRIVDDCGTT